MPYCYIIYITIMYPIKVTLMLLLSLAMPVIHAQSIRLIDKNQHTPIVNASYQYGSQHGVSNHHGIITIKADTSSSMVISHLNYGKMIIDIQQVQEFLKSGIIYWQNQHYELQPVSIIALHQAISDSLSIRFNNQNRLSHDAAAIMSQTPEIALIRKSGNYGFDPVLRGFKYEQLNIVMDGAQSANAACPNRMDPPSSQMPVNMLSQIDILKGPYSLRYGNAIGGTINFRTETPAFTTNSKVDGRVSGSYESNGNIYRNEGLVGFSGKSYNIKLFGSISDGDNYEDGDGHEVPSSFYRNNFGSILAFRLNEKQKLSINVSHNYAKDVDFPALAMDLRKDDTWLGSVQHSITFSDKNINQWSTNIYTTSVDHLMDNYDKAIDPRMVDAETTAKTINYGGRTEGFWQFDSMHLYAGLDYRAEAAEGERSRHFLMGQNQGKTAIDNVWQESNITKIAAFGEFQHILDQWRLVYSGRIEYNYSSADRPDPNFEAFYSDVSSSTINPSFSAGLSNQLTPHFSAELWLGRAQRSGSLTERYINFLPVGIDPYEMLGNPELSSEVNTQIDLNLSYKGSASQLHLSLFTAFINDYISSEIRDDLNPKLPSSPGVRQFVNIDNARQMGFEASWLQKLPAHLQHRLSVAYTYAKNSDTNEALPEIPPLDIRYRLNGRYMDQRLRPELVFRHVLEQNRIAKSYGESTTPSFSLIDLSLNYVINPHFEINAALNNLLDETYYEHLSRSVKGTGNAINAPGRNMILTIVARL